MSRSVSDLLKIFKSSVSAVLPENLIKKSLKYHVGHQQLIVADDKYNLENKNVYMIGTGKAVQNMAIEIENILSSKVKQGIISIPEGSSKYKSKNKNIVYSEGAKNNLPDKNSEITAKQIKDLVAKLGSDDLLLILISGGGSALLSLPKPPITLEEKTALIKSLANSGADIIELNTVRKQLSDLKGGQLAIQAQPAQVISLVLSDIVGDPLDLIASGPTTENKDEPSKAVNILKKYKLFDSLPKSIRTVLDKAEKKAQFPKDKVKNYVIGSNKISIAAGLEDARNMNYCAIGLSDIVTGDVGSLASEYVIVTKLFCSYLKGELNSEDLIMNLKCVHIPGMNTDMIKNEDEKFMKTKDLCLVFGGETTVQVKGAGKGGRNQQLALEFSNYLDKIKCEFDNFDIHFLSAGTDGIDGPTDAAGAIGQLDLIMEAKKENLNPIKYLEENDSYNFYKKFKKGSMHVITGHTNTNVMDIHIIIIRRNN